MASPGFDKLKAFFETAPAAREATRPLSRSAEVALLLDGDEPARFTMESGEPRVLMEVARDPDFSLALPSLAVNQIAGNAALDIGEYGVRFFTLALSRDPERRIRVHIRAPTIRILRNGYLGVLALGGMKVAAWLLRNGVRNPKAAIDRLRNGRDRLPGTAEPEPLGSPQ